MSMTLVDALAPAQIYSRSRILTNATFAVVGSAIIALCSQISFNLPFSPVPITGQTFGVFLVAMAMGANRGAAAVLAYLLEGASGLPVFAGGAGGFAYLFGPTGGYLLGFIPAAWMAGKLAEFGWDCKRILVAAAMTISAALLFICGVAWLSFFVGKENAMTMGVLPFLPGEIIKIIAAAIALPSLRFVLRKRLNNDLTHQQ
jgi:biotin transport system substrate-specific component